MKLLFVALLLLCQFANAQKDSIQSNTMIGAINIKAGTIVKREYIDIASYKADWQRGNSNINFQVLHVTDATTREKLSGLYITTTTLTSTPFLSNYFNLGLIQYAAYIDSDEVGAFIKYLEFISTATEKEEKNNVEYVFTSKDMEFVTFNNRSKKADYIWNFRIKVNKDYSNSLVYIHFKEINDLLQKLKQQQEEIVNF